jgi:hypothetical protein
MQVPLRRRGKARRVAEAGRAAVIGTVVSRWWSLRRPEDEACAIRVGLVRNFFLAPTSGATAHGRYWTRTSDPLLVRQVL